MCELTPLGDRHTHPARNIVLTMCVVFISIYHPCRISSGFSEFRLHFSRESERFGVVNLCEDDRRVIDYASIRGTEIISLRTGHKFERVAKKCDAILSAVFDFVKRIPPILMSHVASSTFSVVAFLSEFPAFSLVLSGCIQPLQDLQ